MNPLSDLLPILPEGIFWLVLTVILAGLVRGFTGFGTALIFVPVAARFLPPSQIVVVLLVMDLVGPMFLVPDALRKGEPAEVGLLGAGALLGIPIGVWMLTRTDPLIFRWIACAAVLLLVGVLATGWRYRRKPGKIATAGIGALSGLMGGFSGLSGPPIVLLYLGGEKAVERIRANIILFFALTELIAAVTFWLNGLLQLNTILLGIVLAVPYTIGTLTGSRVFRRFGELHFRKTAYLVITLAALSSLPVLD